jgi:hypothetical protein
MDAERDPSVPRRGLAVDARLPEGLVERGLVVERGFIRELCFT